MLVNCNGKNIKLPDFLIVGAAKSGTTSLHYYLKQHPQIFLPKVKELYFFLLLNTPPNRVPKWLKKEKHGVSNIGDYAKYFKEAADGQVIGEVEALYLSHFRDTIKNIKEVYGQKSKDLKIIAILRNPVERAWSHFMMNKRDGNESLDFREAIKKEVVKERLKSNRDWGVDYIEVGMYYEQVNAFISEFPQMRVFLYEELRDDGAQVVKEIFNFVGVDPQFMPNMETRYNMSGESSSKLFDYFIVKKNPIKHFLKLFFPYEFRSSLKFKAFKMILRKKRMPDDIKKDLFERYRNNILKLQSLLKRDLSIWLN